MVVHLSGIRCVLYLRQGVQAITKTQPAGLLNSIHSQSSIPAWFLNVTGSFSSQHRQFSNVPRPIVYYTDVSPPSRAVRLTAAAIGLDVDIRNIDLLAGDHLTEEYRKINPEHTVPTLDDNGFAIWDSHAIMCYLVDKYAKDDSLYPKDIRRRAMINQRLYFDAGVLFARLRLITFPLFRRKTSEVSSEKLELLKEAYGHLDKFLEGKQWLCGDSYTLADISCVSTISSIMCVHPIDNFPNVKAWLKRCEDNLPEYATANAPGAKLFQKGVTSLITSKGKI